MLDWVKVRAVAEGTAAFVACESVIVVAVRPVIVVPATMPVPLSGIPTDMPVVLAKPSVVAPRTAAALVDTL